MAHISLSQLVTSAIVLIVKIPGIKIFVDVCLCESTESGHCQLVDDKGQFSDDLTGEALQMLVRSYQSAGATALISLRYSKASRDYSEFSRF